MFRVWVTRIALWDLNMHVQCTCTSVTSNRVTLKKISHLLKDFSLRLLLNKDIIWNNQSPREGEFWQNWHSVLPKGPKSSCYLTCFSLPLASSDAPSK